MYLATEGAQVLAVLTDFCLLDLLPETGTVSCAVLANNSDLFGALRLQAEKHILSAAAAGTPEALNAHEACAHAPSTGIRWSNICADVVGHSARAKRTSIGG